MSNLKPVLPSVSVLIPTYNRAAFLGECIESVLRQTRSPLEVIVVDDGSEDGTNSVIGRFEKAGVQYIRKSHTGAPDSRNIGIDACRGEYILTVGSDDVMFETSLASLLDAWIQWPDRMFYYGNLLATNLQLEPFLEVKYPDWLNQEHRLRSALALTNQIGDGFGMIRRGALEEIGEYSTDFPRCQDWEMWVRAGSDLSVVHCGKTLGYWRWHDQNLSGNRKQHSRVDFDQVIRERARLSKSGEEHAIDLGWKVLEATKQGRPVWIWGAGESGTAMRRMLERIGVQANAFIDSDESKDGSLVGGLPVNSPSALANEQYRPYVMIGSVYEHEIADSLDEMGFHEHEDYDRVHGVEYHRIK